MAKRGGSSLNHTTTTKSGSKSMSNNINTPDAPPLPYYVARYQGRAVTIKRDPDYQATIKLMQSSIVKLRSLDPHNIIIFTRLVEYGDALVQVSKETWSDVLSSVKVVEIMNEQDESEDPPLPAVPSRVADDLLFASTIDSSPMSIILRTTYQELVDLDNIPGAATVRELKEIIQARYGTPVGLQQLVVSGVILDDNLLVKRSGITRGEPVDLVLNTRKSKIYVIPVQSNGYHNSRVSLTKGKMHFSVNRKWELSLRRPIDECPESLIQSTSWTISTCAPDNIIDHHSNSEVRWLLWDGSPSIPLPSQNTWDSAKSTIQLTPGTESYESILTLKFNNSVAVPFKDVEYYVDRVFQSLGVYRGDFISDFLSQVRSVPCSHLAIRFLPQSDYQKVALLSIPEQPNTRVIHVALLYKRLDPRSIPLWDSAPPLQSSYAEAWQKIVDPQDILKGSNGTGVVVVDFTFFEVP